MDYKKLLKRIVAILGISNVIGGILFLTFIATIIGAIQGNKSNNNSYSELNGVPTEYIEYFNEASKLSGIPNWVLAAIAKQESNFNPKDEYGGAYGIMQMQKSEGSIDLWASYMRDGLGDFYKKAGYSFSSSDDMWNKFLKDPKAQILSGAYETLYYTNYVLFKKGIAKSLNYNSVENMKLINWNANESDSKFVEVLKRIFACYNGGPSYGMNVDFNNAQNNYPNQVFQYAMEFRGNGLSGTGQKGDNKTIENAIKAGEKWVGKSPYVWGGGRTESDVKKGRFDCSSFVYYCYSQAGIKLGDMSGVTTWSLLKQGKSVNKKDMKRGDIIFFDTVGNDTHVGLYLGYGKFMHDSSSKGVTISDLNSAYYKSVFNGKVRRIIN
ncbi:NlpC/P60 family protein [Eubacterium multiforme]|uniref:Cell wall-associated NlpC family hydrolase n=1 Tax=Eubacterium multiforme TaxID=83339 RepID=A0ABT9UTJ2_9FIRM|nr:NlpC/P60 family protein [Eubacterium multiforme]MDQ0149629.1 cell wall-associated NlpC family hydrolase [Eubacterium multiforme]